MTINRRVLWYINPTGPKKRRKKTMRSRYETAKVTKALGARRRLLNSDPPIDWDWVDHMMKIL